jgi:hypothetical protein
MRSRRVILRLAPYVATFGLIGSTLAWQDVVSQQLGSDVDTTPNVVVAEHDVPTVDVQAPDDSTDDSSDENSDGESSDQGAEESSEEGDGSDDENSGDSSDEQTDEQTDDSSDEQTDDNADDESDTAVEDEPSTESSSTGPVTIAEMAPQPVKAFSLLGVTWASGMPASAEVEVQWHGHDGWSDWTELHQDLVPGEGGRPGTESQWVEWADQVAVRVTNGESAQPVDVQVATINPGEDTGLAPASASQPKIILRKDWGAKKPTKCSFGTYGPNTQGAIIHHTVGSNDYSKNESAKIVRATQAYHMNSRDWCDIGYNFLVDKYGQIFEGRSGGIDKPVWAAHSGNKAVNSRTVGVSLMGTFTKTAPSTDMKEATAQLVAWRFKLAKLPAKGTYKIDGLKLNRIAGHRNVISTECPGAKAYEWLGAKGGLRDRVEKIMSGNWQPPVSGFKLDSVSSTSFTAHWDKHKDAGTYELRVSKKSDFKDRDSFRITSTSQKVGGLKPSTTYYAKVRVLDKNGHEKAHFTDVKSIKTKGDDKSSDDDKSKDDKPKDAPSGLKVDKKTTSSVKVTWKSVSDAAKYEIQLSKSEEMKDPLAQGSKNLKESFEGLKAGTKYYLRVRALKGDGKALGDWSEPVRATTRT